MNSPICDGEIYQLPDGSHVVALSIGGERYELYLLLEWELYGPDELTAHREEYRQYVIDQEGRVLRSDQPTGWASSDLRHVAGPTNSS